MDKNKKNWLYEFEVKTSSKKEDGSEEIISKKFGILKPNRKMKEDGELFFAAETSRFAKAGVLPRAAWNTILSNGGGSISDKEREIYGGLLIKFRDLTFELQAILFKSETEKTEEEKKRSNEILEELESIKKEIQVFESSQIEIFENTAEAKARNRSILWWTLFLSYEFDGSNAEPVIKGESFEDKLDSYDSLYEEETSNENQLSTLRRLTYLVTIWYLGRASTKQDFELYDKNYSESSKNDEEFKEVETEVVN
jgi:hypothetical protein